MVQIKAADVKRLREMTGAGMMDCKRALTESEGDFDKAVELLRKKGLSAAAKKAGRVAAEGLVWAVAEEGKGVLVEVNSETDFVSRNALFQEFVKKVADLILEKQPSNLDALGALPFGDEGNVADAVTQLIAKIGENIKIRRFATIALDHGVVGAYVHAGGKIASLVGIEGEKSEELKRLAKDLAMHVAAANPSYIRREDVPNAVIEKERNILRERAAASGKPETIIERIVSGQLEKFFAECCLMEQPFVKDGDKKVADVVAGVQKDARVVAMYRYQLGEGIEKAASDFAAEVKAQIHG